MIGRIAGRVIYRAMDHVLIDCAGVGYMVYVSDRTATQIPPIGEYTALFTELLVREDNLQLFGFTTLVEKEWHRLLISVQGIGAKASMAILGTLGPDGVSRAIALGDWNAVKAAPGVGPKIAQRVVNELKDKAPTVMALGATLDVSTPAPVEDDAVIEAPTQAPVSQQEVNPSSAAAQSEALSALTNLGYGPSDAARAVAEATDTGVTDTANLIRAALKSLAPKE
ncbi:MAG: Holliday junction branch migration protein RuvA [Halocynthiibacter sp.]